MEDFWAEALLVVLAVLGAAFFSSVVSLAEDVLLPEVFFFVESAFFAVFLPFEREVDFVGVLVDFAMRQKY